MKVTKFNSKTDIKVNWNLSQYKYNPKKKVSVGQRKLQDFLLTYINPIFLYQECRIPGSKKRFDLLISNKMLIFEYSPESHHGQYNKFFHGSKLGYLKTIKSDISKIEWANKNNFKVIEITDDDLDHLSYNYLIEKFDCYL